MTFKIPSPYRKQTSSPPKFLPVKLPSPGSRKSELVSILSHGLFARQSSVIEGVHVDDFIRFDHDGWLRLVFEPSLALEGNP